MEDVDGHSQKASIMRLIPSFGRAHTEKYYGAKGVVQDCGPRPFKFKSPRGEMNAGLVILRVASERRDAQNERDGAGVRISVAAATPSQQRLRRSSVAAALRAP